MRSARMRRSGWAQQEATCCLAYCVYLRLLDVLCPAEEPENNQRARNPRDGASNAGCDDG